MKLFNKKLKNFVNKQKIINKKNNIINIKKIFQFKKIL